MKNELNDELINCIRACGGSKQVAAVLWPEKAPDTAQRLLLACMNEDRAEKLSPDQVLLILRMARDKGYHGGMEFIAESLGYSKPVLVEPRDEMADLMRSFNQGLAGMAELTARMERAAARVGRD